MCYSTVGFGSIKPYTKLLLTIFGGTTHYVSTATEEQTPAEERKTELKPLNKKNNRMAPQYKTVIQACAKNRKQDKNKTHMSIIKINNICARTRIN